MLHNPAANTSSPAPPERLPNFLLSSATSPSTVQPATPTNSTFPYTSAHTNNNDATTSARPASYPYPTSTAANSPPAAASPWPFPQRRFQGQSVAFNDRLRTNDTQSAQRPPTAPDHFGKPPATSFNPKVPRMSAFSTAALTSDDQPPASTPMRTPSRMPPNKSLLDAGPPSVLNLRSPSASPGAASLTPGSAVRAMHTPTASMIPRTPGTASPVAPGLERWVTVFGFSASMESQVLREFRRHGEIVRTVGGRGNWLHILYRTHLQAEVALHKSWRLLAGTGTMVGVAPCTEPHVAREAEESIERGILVASPSAASPFGAGSANNVLMTSPPPAVNPVLRTPSSILRRDQGHTVNGPQNIVRTPQKQSGILDYITGFYR